MADHMSRRLAAHRIVTQCVVELGKHGFDPVEIRTALALNLVLVCRHSSTQGDAAARSDIEAVLAKPPPRAGGTNG